LDKTSFSEQDEEGSWIERAGKGDAEAIGRLYWRYSPAIFRYAYYRLGDREAAQDLTAEVFVRVIEALPRYRQRGAPFSAWLYRIAGARIADYYRTRRRQPTEELSAEFGSKIGQPEVETESRMAAEELQRVLQDLSPVHQQVIVLRFVERLSHAEVASILGRSEGAVRVLQYRALDALRRLLETEP
jgi:RNA polymerase sigma-70 factor (ECF subfamily)